MNKTILSDIDDVMLNYTYGFLNYHNFPLPEHTSQYPSLHDYLNSLHVESLSFNVLNEMIEQFNESEDFSRLNPMHHSDYYINKLVGEGYDFVLISKCGDSNIVHQRRYENLEYYFPNVDFQSITMIDVFDSKYRYLKQYEHSDFIWIEDNTNNYYIGENVGLKSILLKTQFNKHEDDYISQVSSWDEIYYHIKNWYE